MRLVDGKHVVQQFAAAAADPALGDPVLPRTADRGPHSRDIHRAHCGGNFPAVLGIVIQDKKLDWRLVRKGFAQLLRDPGAGGMAPLDAIFGLPQWGQRSGGFIGDGGGRAARCYEIALMRLT